MVDPLFSSPNEPTLQAATRAPAPDDPTIRIGGPGARSAASTLPAALGRYRVVREIGRGGMGVVLIARDEILERDIAIKFLRFDGGATGAVSERVLREARTLATMNHPNVATIHSLEVDADRPFITMELVEGRSLRERLAVGPLPVHETLSILRQVARGLEAAHAKDVIHRDLKPANVMLRPDGTAKVLDFGLAVRLRVTGDGEAIDPDAGEISGTPGYMSPEQ